MFHLHGEVARLTIDESKRGDANRSFEGGVIGPKGVIKLVHPVLSQSCNGFVQNRVGLTVGDLHLPLV